MCDNGARRPRVSDARAVRSGLTPVTALAYGDHHMRWTLAVCAAFASIGAGCSFFGLDEFEWPSGEAGCEMLNARDGIDPATACELWQPRGPQQDCSFGRRDVDGDGHVAQQCGGDDCDDLEPLAFVAGVEICDAVDNDCNGLVDDVRAIPQAPVTIVDALGAPEYVRFGPTSGGIGVVWGKATAAPQFEIVSSARPLALGPGLGTRTNVNPVEALMHAALADGCPEARVLPNEVPCDAMGRCPSGRACVTAPDSRRICEVPVVPRDPMRPGDCTTHAACSNGSYCDGIELCDPRSPLSNMMGCRPSDTPGSPCAAARGEVCDSALNACVDYDVRACAIADIAIGAAGEEWLATPITTDAFCEGRVRPAYFENQQAMPPERTPGRFLTMRGDAQLSTSWLGIDLEADPVCTGRSRPTADPRGAAGIALATLASNPGAERRRPQALAGWLAAPVCRGVGRCADTAPVALEAIGLWFEEGSAGGTPIAWVNASRDGQPIVIARAVHGTAPSVAAWEAGSSGAGFLVAWAAADGAHARVVGAMDEPAPICGVGPPASPCLDPTKPYNTGGFTAGARRTTQDLAPAGELHLAGEMPRGNVSIAVGATGVDVLLAWAETAAVVVARARLDPAPLTIAERDIMRVPANDPRDVSVVHLAENVAQEGAMLEGGSVGADETGGFAIAWIDRDSTWVVRTSDALDRMLSPGPVAVGPPIDTARAFVDGDGRARLLARSGDSLVLFPSLCGQ